ncbi:hypothetical protein PSHT_12315 [Puccinia striiformis]|uniref:Uncharacterized protein n=1 Tax=Puccinia striiformis TaxID=27350 RepID=A0A2S4UXD2_9BASI|nr:hypothetical protein PSHT_12315 [Puccinia striiformis]
MDKFIKEHTHRHKAQIMNQISCLKTQILNKRNLVNHRIETIINSPSSSKKLALGSPISSSSHKDLSYEHRSLLHSFPSPLTVSGWPSSYSQCGCADACHRSTPHVMHEVYPTCNA